MSSKEGIKELRRRVVLETQENGGGGENTIPTRVVVMEVLRQRFPDYDFGVFDDAEVEVELERERRAGLVVKRSPDDFIWQDNIEDVYDSTKTFRVRYKNGKYRLSIKLPIYEMDTPDIKVCGRIEVKATTPEQSKLLERMRADLLREGNSLQYKFGAKIEMRDGRTLWLDRDEKEHYWIEVDGAEYCFEAHLPDYLIHLGYSTTSRGKESDERRQEIFNVGFVDNETILSRTAKGKLNTDVSTKKEGTSMSEEELRKMAVDNIKHLAEKIWEFRDAELKNGSDLRVLFELMAMKANFGISDLKYRSWEVKYGRKISPEALSAEMDGFYNECFRRLYLTDLGYGDPYRLVAWISRVIDGDIHPFADACGRISRSWSGMILARYGLTVPKFDSREDYYKNLNKSEEEFIEYYQSMVNRAGTR